MSYLSAHSTGCLVKNEMGRVYGLELLDAEQWRAALRQSKSSDYRRDIGYPRSGAGPRIPGFHIYFVDAPRSVCRSCAGFAG
jgi:hypothetical protein